MLQTAFQIVLSAFAFITMSFMIFSFFNTKFYGATMSSDLCCFLQNTPALNAFLMFVVQIILVVVTQACFFNHISNTIIISLDIIYFTSMILLVLYKSLKESHSLLLKVVQ